MSRDPVPALTDRRGPDGTDGDTAVRPGQVMIPYDNVSTHIDYAKSFFADFV